MTASQTSIWFSWDQVDDLPDLGRLDRVLSCLPDGEIIAALSTRRGRGRNEYPVAALWRALVAGVVFQHSSIASLVRELRRNPALLEVCGFDPLPRQGRPRRWVDEDGVARMVHAPMRRLVPGEWAFSRMMVNLVRLEEERGLVSAMVERLRASLMAALPDYGEHLGADGKGIRSHSTGRVGRKTGKASDEDADWGTHTTGGVDGKGRAWEKVKSWFGYGLHVIADTRYELPVSFRITPASGSEQPVLCKMVKELFAQVPALGERCREFSADRGYDQGGLKASLWEDYAIRPLIDTRLLWREEKQEPGYDPSEPVLRLLDPDHAGNVLYTERGEVHCSCPRSGEIRPMAYQGFESDRNTLKYRCPAAAYDLHCRGREACLARSGSKAGSYGRIVRVKLDEVNRRIFTPTPWGSPSWKRGYNRRSALERINARLDRVYGFEVHFVRGIAKMRTRVSLAFSVMMAMALASVHAGDGERMRSLVEPVPLADTG